MSKQIPNHLLESLPLFSEAVYQSPAYEDSTHDIWCLKNIDNSGHDAFLKVCNNTDSTFWRITLDLFDLDLKGEIPNAKGVYELIAASTHLEVPQLLHNSIASQIAPYLLTSEIKGKAVVQEDVNEDFVKGFAQHLANLHKKQKQNWGVIKTPEFIKSEWSARLSKVLRRLSDLEKGKKVGGAQKLQFESLINDCERINVEFFVPVMLDLRWDQFFQTDGKLNALIDLDAFVYAPRELDFVILEYLLSAEYISIFKEEYLKEHTIPDLNTVRGPYRLLLYFMQILGEVDVDDWMSKDYLF